MLQGLPSAGIEAQQIDRIVITHADRDHIGGILDEQGAFVYPNAGYVLWQEAWDFWQDEDNVHEWPPEIVASIRGTLSRLEPLSAISVDDGSASSSRLRSGQAGQGQSRFRQFLGTLLLQGLPPRN